MHNFHQMGNFAEIIALGRQCGKTGFVVVGVCMLAIFKRTWRTQKIAKNVSSNK